MLLVQRTPSVTEEEALSHISTIIIGSAKDWGGHRKERIQNK